MGMTPGYRTRSTATPATTQGGRTRAEVRQALRPGANRLSLVTDPLRLQLFLLTIVTISRVHLHYPILAKMRPVLLLSVAAVGYAYMNPRQLGRANVLEIWPMRLIAIIGALACGSVAFGISLGNSASFILDSFSKTIALAFLIAVSIRRARDLYTYVWAYVISCGILAIFAVFVFTLSDEGSYTARLGELYTYDANDLGLILMIGLPMTLLLLVVDRGIKRVALLAILIGISAGMARSGSRGGFLGLLAVGVACVVLVNGISFGRRMGMVAGALIALALAAPAGYWKQMGTILSPKGDYNYSSIDGRTALMKRGMGYMLHYPIFGIGIYNFAKAECTISPKIQDRPRGQPVRCIAPHNSFVQAGSELGIPGLIAWVTLVLGGITAPISLRRRLPKGWLRGTPSQHFVYAAATFFPVTMIGFAVTAFFVSFAWFDPIYLLAAFLTGLYIAARAELVDAGYAVSDGGSERSTRQPGWRVKRSAQAIGALAGARRAAR